MDNKQFNQKHQLPINVISFSNRPDLHTTSNCFSFLTDKWSKDNARNLLEYLKDANSNKHHNEWCLDFHSYIMKTIKSGETLQIFNLHDKENYHFSFEDLCKGLTNE